MPRPFFIFHTTKFLWIMKIAANGKTSFKILVPSVDLPYWKTLLKIQKIYIHEKNRYFLYWKKKNRSIFSRKKSCDFPPNPSSGIGGKMPSKKCTLFQTAVYLLNSSNIYFYIIPPRRSNRQVCLCFFCLQFSLKNLAKLCRNNVTTIVATLICQSHQMVRRFVVFTWGNCRITSF